MSAALRREDALHARLPSFRAKVARAVAVIAEAADQAPLYVAFSGGKDSLACLWLATQALPDVTAIWTDDELEHPEQPAYIPAACAALGVRLVAKTGTQLHAGWFRPWSDPPFWREPLPGALVTRRRVWEVAADLGFGGVVLGLRAAESSTRRGLLRGRGRVYTVRRGELRCNPLAHWTTGDVWALIGDAGLPYNPVYDTLARVGVPREEQRVGPLPLSDGWTLRAGWPALFRRLEERYGRMWGG